MEGTLVSYRTVTGESTNSDALERESQYTGPRGAQRSTHSNTLVTDTKDCFSIGTNNQIDLPPSSLLQETVFDGVLICVCQVQALASAE